MIATDVELEDSSCPFGCARDDKPVLEGFDRLQGLPGRFRIVRCAACGLMRTNPRPTRDSMSFYYGAGYLPHLAPAEAPPGSELADRLLDAESLPTRGPGRMLEIGCGAGTYLNRMARRGWRVEGLEMSVEAAEHCRELGFTVHRGPIDSAPESCQDLDLVVGWMVIEHLHDPIADLRTLFARTKPGGWLAVSVPNAGSPGLRMFGDAWFPLHLPNHLFHFDSKTLRRALETAGWTVARVFCQPNLADAIASAGYVLSDRRIATLLANLLISYPWRAGRMNLALLPLAYPASLLGLTGRMTAWARKGATSVSR